MTLMKGKVPRILELADRIADDIRRKQLKPGDPYQGTGETAEMLGVSTTAANSAMQVLVKRRIIERRQRRGTFVAMPSGALPVTPLKRIHLVVHENYLYTEGLLSDGIIVGIHNEVTAAQMQFNFVPPDNDSPLVSELISEAMRSQKTEGFVLVRASLQAQRLIAASGLPTVVHGLVHPSVRNIPWIDRDHRAGGELMTRHLINNGFHKILVLIRDRVLRGDHELIDAVRDSAASAGEDLSALTLRCLPADQQAIETAVDEVIRQHAGQRIGIICRSEPLATSAETAVRNNNLVVGKDVCIVLSDFYRKSSAKYQIPWPHLRPVLTPEQIGQHIGRMLAQQALGQPVEPDHEIIPVHLQLPEPSAS